MYSGVMKFKIALFVNVLLTATLAGVHFGGWVYYNAGLDAASPFVFISAQQSIEHFFNPSIAFFMTGTSLSGLVASYYAWKTKSSLLPYIFIAFVCMTVGLILTVVINVPINNEVPRWSALNPPSNWKVERERWDLFNAIRTVLFMIGMATLFLGMTFKLPGKRSKA
jgi:uncharacterized membrane protein